MNGDAVDIALRAERFIGHGRSDHSIECRADPPDMQIDDGCDLNGSADLVVAIPI